MLTTEDTEDTEETNWCCSPPCPPCPLWFNSSSSGRHAPHGVPHVVRDEQRAALVDRDADRASARLALRVDEVGEHLDRLARRRAAGERHEDDAVARARLAVPRPVLA